MVDMLEVPPSMIPPALQFIAQRQLHVTYYVSRGIYQARLVFLLCFGPENFEFGRVGQLAGFCTYTIYEYGVASTRDIDRYTPGN